MPFVPALKIFFMGKYRLNATQKRNTEALSKFPESFVEHKNTINKRRAGT